MAYRENLNPFLTPDRRPFPDSPFKQLPTTSRRGNYPSPFPEVSPGFAAEETDRRFQAEEVGETEKLKWFQSRVAELRVYLSESPKIEKRKIRQIFNWTDNTGLDGGQEKKLLKELGTKVRGLIKENNQLRQNLYSEEIGQLKVQNERLKRIMNTVGRGQAAREKILNEENRYMRDYIQRRGARNSVPEQQIPRDRNYQQEYGQMQSQPIRVDQPEQNEVNSPLFNVQPLSLERLKNLKKYFTLYVNTAVEENDDKMIAQQRAIKSLQQRLVQLQRIQKKLDHLQFQKKVILQQSGKKIKNFSYMVPNVRGDPMGNQYEIQNQQQPNKPQPYLYFSSKERIQQRPRQTQQDQQYLLDDAMRLKQQNQDLRQKYQNLKEKYEVEIENHIKDNVAKQQLSFELQKLQAQYKTMLKTAAQKTEIPNQ